MGSSCRKKNKGFSLLEVVITVAILSVGIILIMQAFSYSACLTGLSYDMIRAVFLSQDKMQEMEFKERLGLAIEGLSDTKDKFEYGFTLGSGPVDSLGQLDFKIKWQRRNRNEEINLNTYYLTPTL